MHKGITAVAFVALLVAAAVVGAARLGPGNGTASSHREAPLIAEDPTADNTDLYAFRSPDRPEHGHDRVQLDPGRGSGRRAELLHVLAVGSLQHLHRPERRRPSGPDLPFPLLADGRAAVPREHGAEATR